MCCSIRVQLFHCGDICAWVDVIWLKHLFNVFSIHVSAVSLSPRNQEVHIFFAHWRNTFNALGSWPCGVRSLCYQLKMGALGMHGMLRSGRPAFFLWLVWRVCLFVTLSYIEKKKTLFWLANIRSSSLAQIIVILLVKTTITMVYIAFSCAQYCLVDDFYHFQHSKSFQKFFPVYKIAWAMPDATRFYFLLHEFSRKCFFLAFLLLFTFKSCYLCSPKELFSKLFHYFIHIFSRFQLYSRTYLRIGDRVPVWQCWLVRSGYDNGAQRRNYK
jgi:hypothetical protein